MDTHNDIDLEILDPKQTVIAESRTMGGVFERVSINGPIAPGTWTLRVSAKSMRRPPQPVYWTAALVSAKP